MLTNLILTVISPDKPGVVEAIAKCVSEKDGNWLESRFAHLAGKFAGVVKVQIADDKQADLTAALDALATKDIRVETETLVDTVKAEKAPTQSASFHAVGPDRQGIVREISQAFVEYNINIEEISTQLSSMPYSGEPIFEAEGEITVPTGVDLNVLHEKLARIADQLGIDISLETDAIA